MFGFIHSDLLEEMKVSLKRFVLSFCILRACCSNVIKVLASDNLFYAFILIPTKTVF